MDEERFHIVLCLCVWVCARVCEGRKTKHKINKTQKQSQLFSKKKKSTVRVGGAYKCALPLQFCFSCLWNGTRNKQVSLAKGKRREGRGGGIWVATCQVWQDKVCEGPTGDDPETSWRARVREWKQSASVGEKWRLPSPSAGSYSFLIEGACKEVLKNTTLHRRLYCLSISWGLYHNYTKFNYHLMQFFRHPEQGNVSVVENFEGTLYLNNVV